MTGLYALKPWYATRLRPVVAQLERHRVTPNQVSIAGVVFGASAGAVIAFVPAALGTGLLVAALLAARLGCANMDGTLARRRPADPVGGVSNELGDRAADLLMLAGFLPYIGSSTAALMLAATLPSWTALAVAAQGGSRSNAGPMGKTERCALVAVAAVTGWFSAVAVVIAFATLTTALIRLRSGRRLLRSEARR
jgi:CDP-diacylglycerol--glycerol-3-phosphate 3-phosphatidyltransferase